MLLIFVSVMLMLFDHHQHHRLNSIHTTLSSLVSPVQQLVNGTGQVFHHMRTYCATQHTLLKENTELKETVFLQKAQLQTFRALEAENVQLRALLQSSARLGAHLLVAEIVKVDADPFKHQVLLDKGKQAGIYVGQPVLDAEGVIGEVIEVFEKTSRVILLSDSSYGIPIENVRNGVRGIVMGTGTVNTLSLHYVPNTVDIQIGDVLVTSGLGGRYPAGYPVGEITEVNRDVSDSFASIHLKPSARLDRTRRVLLIKKQANDAS